MFFAPLATLALLLDRLFGYPAWLAALVPYPVVMQGRLIGWLERQLNGPAFAPQTRLWNGRAALEKISLNHHSYHQLEKPRLIQGAAFFRINSRQCYCVGQSAQRVLPCLRN